MSEINVEIHEVDRDKRIVLTIDPQSSSGDVRRAYADARRRLFRVKPKRVSPRTAAVYWFVKERNDGRRLRWTQLVREFDAQHPEFSFHGNNAAMRVYWERGRNQLELLDEKG